MADDLATREGLGLGRSGAPGEAAGDFTPTPPDAVEVKPGTAANYAWWQRHGGEWVREYDQRKRVQPRYHLQEMMLVDYMLRHAEALHARGEGRDLRVLEFGCGVGRHLRNLSQLPGVDVRGYDQSATMVEGCLAWTGRPWIDEHVTLGPPTGRLPFDDGAFDIVYTSEVLVHVRPEDLPGILAELCRVARGHVLHLEPSSAYRIVAEAHDGCWNHDLVAAYASIDRACETLAAGFFSQTPFRVAVGEPPAYTWSPVMLGLMRRLEYDLLAGLGDVMAGRARAREHVNALREQGEALREELREARPRAARAERLEAEVAAARKAEARAEEARIRAEARNLANEQRAQRLEERLKGALARASELDERLTTLRGDLEAMRASRDALRGSLESQTRRAAQLEASLKRQIHLTRDTTVHLERLNRQQREAAARLMREREAIVRRVAQGWQESHP